MQTTLRVARATDRLDEVVRFYVVGLGLDQLGSFENHEGFDGVMVGIPGASYHLEFTHQRGNVVGNAPTPENLLVFYLPDNSEWTSAVNRMEAAGYQSVPSLNPYWDRHGRTFEDPDGYRVVLQHADWPQNAVSENSDITKPSLSNRTIQCRLPLNLSTRKLKVIICSHGRGPRRRPRFGTGVAVTLDCRCFVRYRDSLLLRLT